MINDRGIKKFAAFKSLKGQYEILNEEIKKNNMIEMPELQDDQIEKIACNLALLNSNNNQTVDIKYFDKGYVQFFLGPVKKITNKYLILANRKSSKIIFSNIINLEIID